MKIYAANIYSISIDNYIPYFSSYRRERIKKIKTVTHAVQSAASEALLCYAAKKEGVPLPLDIKTEPGGKPYADNLNFSISHSGEMVLLAVSAYKVGVDIQKINKNQNLKSAKKILTPAEAENIDVSTFFKYFTMKESYFKMTGEGLPLSPKPFTDFKKCYFKTWEKFGYAISVCSPEKFTADIEFLTDL